jgi:type I restriction enzyme S subunit
MLIKNRRVDLAADEPRFVDEATYRRWMRTPLLADDVILTSEAPLGEVAYISEPFQWCLGQRLFCIRTRKERLNGRFLYYALQSEEVAHDLHSRATGTTAQGIRQTELRRVRIPLPSSEEQRAIAHILGTLDDKIELNRRMNETLEAVAWGLFKSWFVDFDPVRAKAEGHDTGLPQSLADLFPDFFEDSELGEIPTGWRLGRFGDVVEQLRDQENPLSSPDALFHHFSIPAFDEGQAPRPEYGESIKSLKSRVPPGVILLSKLNPEIERVWMVDVRRGERAVCSTEFLVLRALSPFTRSYVYCLARSPLFRQQIESLVTGTSKSHQRAQVESILNLAVVVPPSSIVAGFDRLANSLLARTFECRRESHSLAALRDTLLPKLISGELRVEVAERFIRVGT